MIISRLYAVATALIILGIVMLCQPFLCSFTYGRFPFSWSVSSSS